MGFKGLKEEDFLGIKGTGWRGRNNEDGLAKPLLPALRRATGEKFESWGVPRETELHIAKRSSYKYQNAQPFAKLFVWLSRKRDALLCGYRIEKPREEDPKTCKEHWYWKDFIQNLESKRLFKESLEGAINSLGLKIGIKTKGQGQQEVWKIVAGPNEINWEEILRELERYGKDEYDEYLDLYIYREIPRRETIGKGAGVIDEILPVLVALVPIYNQTIRRDIIGD